MNIGSQHSQDIPHHFQLLDILDRITQISLASESMDDVMRGVLDLMLEIFRADRAWFLYPCDPAASFWSVPLERTRPGWPGLFLQGVDIPMDAALSDIFEELLGANSVIQYGPDADHPLPPIVVEHFSVKSQLMIALRLKVGKAWVFGVHHCDSGVMHSEEELQLFTAIAYRISDTLSAFISTRKLRESEEKFRALFDSTSDAVMLMDESGFIDCNNATLEIFGCATSGEFNSKSPSDFSPSKQPCGTDSLSLSKQRIATAMEKGSNFFEWVHMRADTGECFSAEVLLSVTKLNGKSVVQATVRDITERKRAEESLQQSSEEIKDLYNNAPCGYHSLDKDGIICQINNTELKWLGYTRDEVIGKMAWTDLVGVESVKLYKKRFPQLMEMGRLRDIECEMIRKDGTTFFGIINATAIYDSKGDFLMSRSTVTNIDRLKMAEHQHDKLAAHLQTVREEEKIGISREIHDDLGGTLTAMKIEAHWLKAELLAGKETTSLLDRVEVMSQLVDNAAASMRSIVTGLRPTMIDDLGLLAALEWQAEQFQKRTGINCLVNCIGNKGNLDKRLSIVLFRISQEALTNVLRHSGASQVEIEYHHNDDEVVLSIIDNGCGISKGKTDRSACYGVSGMQERVKQYDGKISFDIPLGGGLNVTVILPLFSS